MLLLATAAFMGSAPGIAAIVATVIALILMAGLLAGQFRRGVVTELRDALESARTEIEIANSRADRLERLITEMEHRIHELEARPDYSKVVELLDSQTQALVKAIREENDIRATDQKRIAAALADQLAISDAHLLEVLKATVTSETGEIVSLFRTPTDAAK